MLRYDRQTKPGLVALYGIRPGNGAGPFLQPRSPHGALVVCNLQKFPRQICGQGRADQLVKQKLRQAD